MKFWSFDETFCVECVRERERKSKCVSKEIDCI